jgi:hypothetical protein
MSARAKLGGGAEPILIGGSLGEAPGFPHLMRELRNVVVTERTDPVSDRRSMRVLRGSVRMFMFPAGLLSSREVFLLPMLLADAMGMSSGIVQF